MELKNQVVRLELAKKLKELGVKQESLFWWVDFTDGYSEPSWNLNDNHVGYKAHLSAFTVAELGEMLPFRVSASDGFFYYESGQAKPNDEFYPKWEVSYSVEDDVLNLERSETEADARAKMLIYLLENNLLNDK